MFIRQSKNDTRRSERPTEARESASPTKAPPETFEAFMASIRARMTKGKEEYGDRSFSEHPSRLITELQEELEDVCGWGFILWTRLERMRTEIEKTEANNERTQTT